MLDVRRTHVRLLSNSHYFQEPFSLPSNPLTLPPAAVSGPASAGPQVQSNICSGKLAAYRSRLIGAQSGRGLEFHISLAYKESSPLSCLRPPCFSRSIRAAFQDFDKAHARRGVQLNGCGRRERVDAPDLHCASERRSSPASLWRLAWSPFDFLRPETRRKPTRYFRCVAIDFCMQQPPFAQLRGGYKVIVLRWRFSRRDPGFPAELPRARTNSGDSSAGPFRRWSDHRPYCRLSSTLSQTCRTSLRVFFTHCAGPWWKNVMCARTHQGIVIPFSGLPFHASFSTSH